MFYNRGEVFSDQFDHFKLILFWVPECSFCKKNLTKRDKVGIFRLRGGEHPFPLLQTIIQPISEHFCENQKCSLCPKKIWETSLIYMRFTMHSIYEMKGFNSLMGSHYDHYFLSYQNFSPEKPADQGFSFFVYSLLCCCCAVNLLSFI